MMLRGDGHKGCIDAGDRRIDLRGGTVILQLYTSLSATFSHPPFRAEKLFFFLGGGSQRLISTDFNDGL